VTGSERAKTVHASDHSATVTGFLSNTASHKEGLPFFRVLQIKYEEDWNCSPSSCPDEITTMGAARKYFLKCVHFRREMTRTGNKPRFDVCYGSREQQADTQDVSGRCSQAVASGLYQCLGQTPFMSFLPNSRSVANRQALTQGLNLIVISLFKSLRRNFNLEDSIFPHRQHGGDGGFNYE
jgi:hypothetical protein